MRTPDRWPLARWCDRRPARWWLVVGFVLGAWGLAGGGDLPEHALAAAHTATHQECTR